VAASSAAAPAPRPDTSRALTTFVDVVAALYLAAALILLLPLSRRVDGFLLPVLDALRFGWADLIVRERLSLALVSRGDVRGALHVRRRGVERAVEHGGFELLLSAAAYGEGLLASGWIAEGVEFLQVAERMTSGWPSGQLRDPILVALAGGRAFRGEADEGAAAAVPLSRPGTRLHASQLGLRAAQRLAAGDAAGAADTYRDALASAQSAAHREQVVVVNNNLAGALIEAGDLVEAEARIVAAEASVSRFSRLRGSLLGTRAELALARRDLGAAREALDRSAALKTQSGSEGGLGWTMATRARLEAAAGNPAEAKRLLDRSADMLEDVGALRAWRLAATAIGVPGREARLALPAPDPLLDRVRPLAREVPIRAWLVFRGTIYGVVLSMGFAVFWFAVRFRQVVLAGWSDLTVALVFFAVLLLAWIIARRAARS
jgi:tetratricopeptide (TPR) repeat protein